MTWIEELRALFDSTFNTDWDSHIAKLNSRYQFEVGKDFSTVAPGLPPVWFNGDVEAVSPGRWTLVISINPGSNPLPAELYQRQFATPQSSWDHWRTYNSTVRRTQSDFFAKLAELASDVLGHAVAPADRAAYSTNCMVFVEVCPYASPGWPPKQPPGAALRWTPNVEQDFFAGDPGVAVCSEITRLLLDAEPALVMVNGSPAVRHFERMPGTGLTWQRRNYESASKPGKRLWHMEGRFCGAPALGFPQLRRMLTHNSASEVAQLAAFGRALVSGNTG